MHGIRYRWNSAIPALMPRAIHRLSDRDRVCITIDDAPSGNTLDVLLELSLRRAIPLTFFLRGDMTEQFPDIAAQIVSAGHEVGSHGYRHIPSRLLDAERLNDDIQRSIQVIDDVCGTRPVLYRPPYGRLSPMLSGLPAKHGCRTILWNRMPDDWDPSISTATLTKRLNEVSGGDIVVLHEHPGRQSMLAAAVDALANALERKDLIASTITDAEGLT
ncbi:MAG: hypothetical protein C0600_06265 [Ignavibacteria bacterium]|nr:MAG: hypothetical protein C0600_06265 [Ignavibacteria bacterium]